jgi:hypothetical protein
MLHLDLRGADARSRWQGGLLLFLLAVCFAWAGLDEGQPIAAIGVGVALAIAGLYVIAGRHLLVVGSGRVTRRRGLFLSFDVVSNTVAGIEKITLWEVARRSGKRKVIRYRVSAVGSSSRVLAELPDPWHARHVAERLCVALNVPFHHDVYGANSVRNPHEVDAALVERWRIASTTHERPGLPPDTRLRVEEHDRDVVLSTPAETWQLKYAALLTAAFAAFGTLFYRGSSTGGARIVLLGVLGVAGAAVMAAALQSSGRAKIVFSGNRVRVRLGWWPFASSMSIADIEEMIPASDGINLVGDARALWIPWGRSHADSEFLRKFVAYELARRAAASAAARLD